MRYPRTTPGGRAGIAAAIALVAAGWHGVAMSHENFYQGHATGASGLVTINGIRKRVLLADNYMSCIGKPKDETINRLTHAEPIDVLLEEVHTFTQGIADTSASEVKVANLDVKLPDLRIQAGALEAFAQATCDENFVTTASGGSTVARLTINGEGITITGEPNQTIEIPGVATVIINEQKRFKPEFRATALHIKLFNEDDAIFGDVFFGFAKAKVVCSPL